MSGSFSELHGSSWSSELFERTGITQQGFAFLVDEFERKWAKYQRAFHSMVKQEKNEALFKSTAKELMDMLREMELLLTEYQLGNGSQIMVGLDHVVFHECFDKDGEILPWGGVCHQMVKVFIDIPLIRWQKMMNTEWQHSETDDEDSDSVITEESIV